MPFQDAVKKLPALEKVADPSATLDTPRPSHRATNELLSLSRRWLWKAVLKDIGQGHAAFFRSETLVDASNRDSRRLNSKLTAYLLDPDPNDPDSMYAASIGGTCDHL